MNVGNGWMNLNENFRNFQLNFIENKMEQFTMKINF